MEGGVSLFSALLPPLDAADGCSVRPAPTRRLAPSEQFWAGGGGPDPAYGAAPPPRPGLAPLTVPAGPAPFPHPCSADHSPPVGEAMA